MPDLTRLLDAAAAGDGHAASELLPLVYDELRRLAAARLAHEKPGQTLDATALVHEAYLRLIGDGAGGRDFANRRHFFAAAAEAMRRILIDRARQRLSDKHGGGRQRVPLTAVADITRTPTGLIAVNEALDRLAAETPKRPSSSNSAFSAA